MEAGRAFRGEIVFMSVSILQKDSGKRMEYAAKVLERAGFEVHSDGNSADFDAILLPPPSKRFILGDSGLFNDLRSGYGGIVFVGSSAEWFRNELRYAVTVDYSGVVMVFNIKAVPAYTVHCLLPLSHS